MIAASLGLGQALAFDVGAVGLADSGDWLARLRIRITYAARHGRLPDLDTAPRFTEMVQRRKLLDHDPRQPHLQDKVAVKRWVADRLGEQWVTPTLWQGTSLPETPTWPIPFVVKSRHGCNQRAFVRTGREDWPTIRAAAARWVGRRYGGWLDEWLYSRIAPGVLVEPFIGTGGALPIDYKFYVFAGEVVAVQVHLDREHAHRWMLFDPQWQRLSSSTADADPVPPASLTAMLTAAATLGRDFDFVRVDFYEVDGQPRFGEMTFYPGSGLDPFAPDSLDFWLGAHWHAAQARMRSPARPLDLAA